MAYSADEILEVPQLISLPVLQLPAGTARAIAQTQAPLFQSAAAAAQRQFSVGGIDQYKTWIYAGAGLVLMLALLRRR